jgi:hypothetical protein
MPLLMVWPLIVRSRVCRIITTPTFTAQWIDFFFLGAGNLSVCIASNNCGIIIKVQIVSPFGYIASNPLKVGFQLNNG